MPRKRAGASEVTPAPRRPVSRPSRSPIRLRLREEFFHAAGIDPPEFLQAFHHVPGLFYFVKDAQSRTMLNTREYTQRMGDRPEDDVVGRRAGEYLAKEFADHYEADDRRVIESGQPLRNIIEIGFDEHGVPDWIITDKYPLRDAAGRVVGIMGTMQSFTGRLRASPTSGRSARPSTSSARTSASGCCWRHRRATSASRSGSSSGCSTGRSGMSIQQFVIHSRVHAAAHELTHSDRAIAAVALMFGFTDQSRVRQHVPQDDRVHPAGVPQAILPG